MPRSFWTCLKIVIAGLMTGAMYVVIYAAAKAYLFADYDLPPAWLAIPLASPFGILVAIIVRNELRSRTGAVGVRMMFSLVAWTILAFVIAAGFIEFVFTDDDAATDLTYAVAGGIGGFIGATFLATVIWIQMRRSGARFAGWPMAIAGLVVGACWSEEAFFLRPPLTTACLLFPLWQACVATALWLGMGRPPTDSPLQLGDKQ